AQGKEEYRSSLGLLRRKHKHQGVATRVRSTLKGLEKNKRQDSGKPTHSEEAVEFTKICVPSSQFDSTTTTTQVSLIDENTGIRQEANKPISETPTRTILESTTNEIETGNSQMAANQNSIPRFTHVKDNKVTTE
ncbi:20949_t:CDS:2, partial [Gigaspora rosea]